MSIFDFLHSFIDEVRPQRGRVVFQAPEPISNGSIRHIGKRRLPRLKQSAIFQAQRALWLSREMPACTMAAVSTATPVILITTCGIRDTAMKRPGT